MQKDSVEVHVKNLIDCLWWDELDKGGMRFIILYLLHSKILNHMNVLPVQNK